MCIRDRGFIEQTSAARVQKYTDKLYARLKELLDGRDIDDARILTEAAIFADKTAVDEETVRLRSHIRQYRDILALSEPVGRKLDFLTQELNRETNTIGSKCNELDITRVVVEICLLYTSAHGPARGYKVRQKGCLRGSLHFGPAKEW